MILNPSLRSFVRQHAEDRPGVYRIVWNTTWVPDQPAGGSAVQGPERLVRGTGDDDQAGMPGKGRKKTARMPHHFVRAGAPLFRHLPEQGQHDEGRMELSWCFLAAGVAQSIL